ncbi:MAG: TIGR01906 family membrane protein [Lachnospiraceae bacterium]|nr:TIGR01906 family membrane protein [Lachnospiraceae bacterium]
MKLLHRSFGFIFSIAMILILFVTAFDIAVYGNYGFFQKEYEKYEVLDDLNMEMDDVMEVTAHMMDYLRDRNDDMQIVTTVGGQQQEFFNVQDIFHMDEVKVLFLGMFKIRTISTIVALLSLGVLIATRAGSQTIFRCFQAGMGIFFGIAAILGIIVASNFSKFFVIFHEIFFDNDLWLFDPRTDLMIRMLPEGLFMDFSVRILLWFVGLLAAFEGFLLTVRRLASKKGNLKKAAKTASAILAFCLCLTGMAETSMAVDMTDLPDWPSGPSVQAQAAILLDANSGNILYGKNIHDTYAPASITKILTALVACENNSMGDTVTFSRNAVYDLPWDSSKVGFSQDERVNLKDALYGLMLKSGNEAANGIAEHVAGSVANFAEMMNARAAQAGALNSHFVNPHGLHHEEHYTTAYDMAMILRAAVKNDTFLEIASTNYYEIAPTNINKDGYKFSCGHKMLRKNQKEYYEYAVAGKTGYTSKAGNTLVTYAKKGDLELICVILKSKQTQYTDTKALLDYGFTNFTTYNAAKEDTSYSGADFTFFSFLNSTFENTPMSVVLDDCYITLPATVPFSSVDSRLDQELTDQPAIESDGADSKNLLGYVIYEYKGIEVGRAALRLVTTSGGSTGSLAILPGSALNTPTTPGDSSSQTGETAANDSLETAPSSGDEGKVIAVNIWHLLGYIFVGVLIMLIAVVLLRYYSPKQRRIRKAKQMRRIYTTDERRKQRKRRELR